LAGAGFDPGHDPPLFIPGLGSIAGLGKTAQHLGLVQGAAHPDIIGGRFDQSIEHDVGLRSRNRLEPHGTLLILVPSFSAMHAQSN